MFNGTSVILAATEQNKRSVFHVDSNGKLLKERNFTKANFDSLFIVSDR